MNFAIQSALPDPDERRRHGRFLDDVSSLRGAATPTSRRCWRSAKKARNGNCRNSSISMRNRRSPFLDNGFAKGIRHDGEFDIAIPRAAKGVEGRRRRSAQGGVGGACLSRRRTRAGAAAVRAIPKRRFTGAKAVRNRRSAFLRRSAAPRPVSPLFFRREVPPPPAHSDFEERLAEAYQRGVQEGLDSAHAAAASAMTQERAEAQKRAVVERIDFQMNEYAQARRDISAGFEGSRAADRRLGREDPEAISAGLRHLAQRRRNRHQPHAADQRRQPGVDKNQRAQAAAETSERTHRRRWRSMSSLSPTTRSRSRYQRIKQP